MLKIGKFILVIGVCIFIYYICFYKQECYIVPEHWKFDFSNNQNLVTVSRSYSYTKWKHKCYINGDEIYIKIYVFPFINPFIKNFGMDYTFEIPTNIKNIYSYTQNNEPILIYHR